jgi:hypothetical protein
MQGGCLAGAIQQGPWFKQLEGLITACIPLRRSVSLQQTL